MNEVSDHLDHGLQIVFVGFNPSPKSGELGHHYANPRNHFWKLLYESGLTPRLYAPNEDGDLLKLGYGFTNIVSRPTRGVDDITREEYRVGREILREKLEYYRPQITCFVGKGVYQEFTKQSSISWGFQPQSFVDGVHEFVAPSSSGLVRMPMSDIIAIYQQLGEFIQNASQ
ncbi:TDG/mug DNA glycosylase family protein [Paenibacillus shirakamiensis]|uniref:TDG/mug DNA glycosylase family protein n=1 Tax=Paenibacillus shirakamiensis TaxID=1265935 RepID=A0ABS4JJF2_9BACL|nr:mismatch-specific DNA-glycosylase [Paenibacillus shirakamiensis]MBP2000744.1 TDG/mug DNA glycosylase family protein [Paenibacillus shirakamiensis]